MFGQKGRRTFMWRPRLHFGSVTITFASKLLARHVYGIVAGRPSLPQEKNFAGGYQILSAEMVASQLDGAAPAIGTQLVANGSVAAADQFAPHDIHVLLVDDERLSRVVVANLLRKCNYKGLCLSQGLAALHGLFFY